MNQVIWYDKVVELKVRDIFNTSAVLSFTGAIYGDSRIERVRSILVDLSPCRQISVTEADAVTAGAIASAGARYTDIPKVACVSRHAGFAAVASYGAGSLTAV